MATSIKKAKKLIARNVVVIRQESGITQAEMAEATGVSKRTIQRIEHASFYNKPYNPLLSTAVKIANAVDVTVQDLISEKLEVQ